MSLSLQNLSELQKALDSITGLPDEQYLEALKNHVNSVHAPKSVKDVLQHLFTVLKGCKEREEAKANEVSEYSRKIRSVYDHYTILEDMYKTEHKAVLTLRNEKAELQAKMDEFPSRLEQRETEFAKQLEAQKEEFAKLATKQALGRKKIEEKLMFKEMEAETRKKKLQELEHQNTKLQLDIQTNKYLLQFYLTPQQQSQFLAQQQQQQLTQQQQQQLTQQLTQQQQQQQQQQQ